MKTLTLLALLALAIPSAQAQQSPPQAGQNCCAGARQTAGWSMMSPEERTEHRKRMHAMKSYEECVAYQKEHHDAMAKRAKEKGITLHEPRMQACDRMKARGLLK